MIRFLLIWFAVSLIVGPLVGRWLADPLIVVGGASQSASPCAPLPPPTIT